MVKYMFLTVIIYGGAYSTIGWSEHRSFFMAGKRNFPLFARTHDWRLC